MGESLGDVTSDVVASRELDMLEKVKVDKMTKKLSVSREQDLTDRA